uniref:Phage baseplate J-like protein n=1 Tax=Hydrogenovibrio crunogenus (strain DSM 25203 / XCL-2) TaxID=317025 RepID=Q31HT8_HYDCU
MNIDLSKLPAPAVIETLDYETILAEMKADLTTRLAAIGITYSGEPHDPMTKELETAALRELQVRQSHNEKATQIMLAYAKGTNLDALGALPWIDTPRLTITPEDTTTTPPTAAIMEDDEPYRERMQLSYNQLTTAGSAGSYRYHAKTASGSVKDVSAVAGGAGVVTVTILSNVGDGTADQALIDTVQAYLDPDTIRPLSDTPQVQSAEILTYTIDATLTIYPGISSQAILDAVNASIAKFVDDKHKIGYSITLPAVHAALNLSGVQDVSLAGFNEVTCTQQQAPYCSSIAVTIGGTGV